MKDIVVSVGNAVADQSTISLNNWTARVLISAVELMECASVRFMERKGRIGQRDVMSGRRFLTTFKTIQAARFASCGRIS